jgi:hypothetical protein
MLIGSIDGCTTSLQTINFSRKVAKNAKRKATKANFAPPRLCARIHFCRTPQLIIGVLPNP